MSMNAARALAWTLAVAGVLAAISLVLLLAYTPVSECVNSDYDSPTTPLHSGGVAFGCFLYSIVGLVAGLSLLVRRRKPGSAYGRRVTALALLTFLAGGAAVFADVARWTCWP